MQQPGTRTLLRLSAPGEAGKFPPLSRAPRSRSETSQESDVVVPEILLQLALRAQLAFAMAFPARLRAGLSFLLVFFGFALPWRSPCCSGILAGWSRVWNPARVQPSWRHPAQPPRSGSGGTGRCCWQRGVLGREGRREGGIAARSPPALHPPPILTQPGLGALCPRKAPGGV